MPRTHSEPPFDIFSYARRGPARRHRLSPAQIESVSRTVRRTPEVMVKVLPRVANDVASVRKHVDYIDRKGKLDLETDDGRKVRGSEAGEDLLSDWDLTFDEHRSTAILGPTRGKASRLVHKVVFSMPAGTAPEKVLVAVRNFCREEFALKHRYVMALHTDEPHPHVHVVVKAVNEEGVRLNIRKATLREWRQEFARNLRELGVEANATPRAVRGESRTQKLDGIYRAQMRGNSRHMRERVESAAAALTRGERAIETGKEKLLETRRQVRQVWLEISEAMIASGQSALAGQIRQFVAQMAPPRTEREQIIDHLRRYREKTPLPERKQTK